MTDLKTLLTDYVRSNEPTADPPALPGTESGSPAGRRRRWILGAAGVAAALVILLVASPWTADVPELTVLDTDAASSDRLPSTTAQDWVTYADHVVVVTAVEDEAGDPVPMGDADSSGPGDDEGTIPRTVSLRVDDVVWSAPSPRRAAPQTFDIEGWGWRYQGSPENPEDRGRIVGEGTSRVEVGHTYLMAISWEEARCSPGDPREPAQWSLLGSGAVAPFDDGVVGQGEFEGEERSPDDFEVDPADPNVKFWELALGETGDEVGRTLDETEPGKRERFTDPAPCI